MKTGGIVLCGGQSSRMGRPKAWLPFGDELLLQRVVRIVSEVVEPIVVVAAPNQDVPPLPDEIAIVRDEALGRGPLQGLAAGFGALRGLADAAFASSCDVPFLQPDFIRTVIDSLGDAAICVPFAEGHHHPLAAVYRIEVVAAVRRLLDQNRMRPVYLFDEVATRVLSDVQTESLRNVNSPEEYAAALAHAPLAPRQ